MRRREKLVVSMGGRGMPAVRPKPPSKFRQDATYCAARPTSSASRQPSSEQQLKAQYEKLRSKAHLGQESSAVQIFLAAWVRRSLAVQCQQQDSLQDILLHVKNLP